MTEKLESSPGGPTPVRKRTRALYAALAILIALADQTTKFLVERGIPEHALIPVIPGLLNLTHSKNPGVAFGMFSDSPAPWKTALLVVVSAALLAVVVYTVWRARELHWASGVGVALIAGGAISNLADRVRAGLVVDFVDAYFRSYHWYTFNLADSAIVVGACFLVVHLLISD
ncbi:MAG: signal peptidase II [Terriglobia bacterium]